mmetsp:Transcript_15108/g.17112  ORF Transcript_15108/g.17112 Transcript_15108/m.17112 type:complete len:121 (-) Transcript_15108:4-366(-)
MRRRSLSKNTFHDTRLSKTALIQQLINLASFPPYQKLMYFKCNAKVQLNTKIHFFVQLGESVPQILCYKVVFSANSRPHTSHNSTGSCLWNRLFSSRTMQLCLISPLKGEHYSPLILKFV